MVGWRGWGCELVFCGVWVTIHRSRVGSCFDHECKPEPTTGEVSSIMRAFDPEVFDVVWSAVEPLVPDPVDSHPLGCHRRRAPARACFEVIVIRLVTGCSWVDAECLAGCVVSDTTVCTRRNEWVSAGV
jgi:hypothetical protein